jgi:hypothetical protein
MTRVGIDSFNSIRAGYTSGKQDQSWLHAYSSAPTSAMYLVLLLLGQHGKIKLSRMSFKLSVT